MGHAPHSPQTQSITSRGGGSLAAAGTTKSHTRYGVAACYRCCVAGNAYKTP